MTRLVGFVGVLLVSMLLGTPSAVAGSGTRAQADGAARKAASKYIERFGISYRPSQWNAVCTQKPASSWRCSVWTKGGGQCRGTVLLRSSFKPYRTRIGCGESKR